MLLVDDARICPPRAKGAVLALGNFDGVHLGHRAVIAAAQRLADAHHAPAGVATFEPAPRRFFQPDAPPFRLMTPLRRQLTLAALGLDVCVLLRFDAAMAAMTDREFVDVVLTQELGVRAVAVGFDFTFGKGRMGDAERLKELCAERAVAAEVVGRIDAAGGEKISSTAIRSAIAAGEMEAAAALLGQPYVVDALVEHGEKRGRTLGFPTANLKLGDLIAPAHGVYAVWARIDGESVWRQAVASFGRTPTTGLRDPLLEVVLFDWPSSGESGDLYGQRLHIAWARFLRAEARFEGVGALVAQMHRDADAARAALDVMSPPIGL